jgi:hypothetical protein
MVVHVCLDLHRLAAVSVKVLLDDHLDALRLQLI